MKKQILKDECFGCKGKKFCIVFESKNPMLLMKLKKENPKIDMTYTMTKYFDCYKEKYEIV